VFKGEAELAEKFALGSSVTAEGKSGDRQKLRFIIKTLADLEGDKEQTLRAILGDAWTWFAGSEVPLSAVSGEEVVPDVHPDGFAETSA
jgi:hypothetical protein